MTYGGIPGWKSTDTSRAAAIGMISKAGIYREQVKQCVQASGARGITPEECADHLGVHVTTVRPRFTELSNDGHIQDSGLRRKNANGKSVIVWVVA